MISPDDGARLAIRAAQAAAAAERAALEQITRRLAQGRDVPGWRTAKLAQVQQLRRELTRMLALEQKRIAAEVDAAIEHAYTVGANAVAAASSAATGATLTPVISYPPAQRHALQVLAADVQAALSGAVTTVLRNSVDAYQAAVAAEAAVTVLGTETRLVQAQRVLDRLARQGIGAFTDKRGAVWRLESYVEMATRTATTQSLMQGAFATLRERGHDLVHVIPGPRPCPVCDSWAGRVLSVSGSADAFIDGGSLRTPDGSVAGARAAGLFHPNCRCVCALYTPGTTETTTARTDGSTYEDSQKQRALERRIRDAKMQQSAALDPQAAKQRGALVRQRQAEMRQFLSGHPDLTRRYYREQVGRAR